MAKPIKNKNGTTSYRIGGKTYRETKTFSTRLVRCHFYFVIPTCWRSISCINRKDAVNADSA